MILDPSERNNIITEIQSEILDKNSTIEDCEETINRSIEEKRDLKYLLSRVKTHADLNTYDLNLIRKYTEEDLTRSG